MMQYFPKIFSDDPFPFPDPDDDLPDWEPADASWDEVEEEAGSEWDNQWRTQTPLEEPVYNPFKGWLGTLVQLPRTPATEKLGAYLHEVQTWGYSVVLEGLAVDREVSALIYRLTREAYIPTEGWAKEDWVRESKEAFGFLLGVFQAVFVLETRTEPAKPLVKLWGPIDPAKLAKAFRRDAYGDPIEPPRKPSQPSPSRQKGVGEGLGMILWDYWMSRLRKRVRGGFPSPNPSQSLRGWDTQPEGFHLQPPTELYGALVADRGRGPPP